MQVRVDLECKRQETAPRRQHQRPARAMNREFLLAEAGATRWTSQGFTPPLAQTTNSCPAERDLSSSFSPVCFSCFSCPRWCFYCDSIRPYIPGDSTRSHRLRAQSYTTVSLPPSNASCKPRSLPGLLVN